jgi:hypothetical protein
LRGLAEAIACGAGHGDRELSRNMQEHTLSVMMKRGSYPIMEDSGAGMTEANPFTAFEYLA